MSRKACDNTDRRIASRERAVVPVRNISKGHFIALLRLVPRLLRAIRYHVLPEFWDAVLRLVIRTRFLSKTLVFVFRPDCFIVIHCHDTQRLQALSVVVLVYPSHPVVGETPKVVCFGGEDPQRACVRLPVIPIGFVFFVVSLVYGVVEA